MLVVEAAECAGGGGRGELGGRGGEESAAEEVEPMQGA